MRYLIAILVAAVLIDGWMPGFRSFLASLDQAGFTFGATVGFLFGLGIIILGYRIIHNGLVESDRRSDIAGVNKKHDARRI